MVVKAAALLTLGFLGACAIGATGTESGYTGLVTTHGGGVVVVLKVCDVVPARVDVLDETRGAVLSTLSPAPELGEGVHRLPVDTRRGWSATLDLDEVPDGHLVSAGARGDNGDDNLAPVAATTSEITTLTDDRVVVGRYGWDTPTGDISSTRLEDLQCQ